MRARRASCVSWPIGSVTGTCLALGGGGYDRGNLARTWSGVVEAMLEA